MIVKNKNNKRSVGYNNSKDKIINYSGDAMFESYTAYVDKFNKELSLGCSFIYYTPKDEPINRRIKLTRSAAFKLTLDLIRFIITGRI